MFIFSRAFEWTWRESFPRKSDQQPYISNWIFKQIKTKKKNEMNKYAIAAVALINATSAVKVNFAGGIWNNNTDQVSDA